MDLEVWWHRPFDLVPERAEMLSYSIPELEYIPTTPGVYVFARTNGSAVAPLYIGKAQNLARRIGQQLNNVRLMKGIEDAQRGYRRLLIGEFSGKPGQRAATAIRMIETALIRAAMVKGYDILNIKGAMTPVHSLALTGNRKARSWLPGGTISLPRGA